MAIQKEIWLADIEGNLFPDNAFYMRSVDDTPFVIGGKTVHVPNAGAKAGTEKNRTSLPATVNKRTDTFISYDLDEFTTDPLLLQDTEAIEVSYDKRQSILSENILSLDEQIADNFMFLWAATQAGNLIRTTGAARAATAPSATGNRKAVSKDDIIEANRLFNRQDIPRAGRYMLIPADMESDILKIAEFVSAEKIGGEGKLANGAIGRLLGFDVYIRSRTAIYSNAATPAVKAVGAAGATTDNLSILFWHQSFVRRAKGTVVPFADEDSPVYYGDVFSALVRAGGRISRSDEKGIVSLVQDASA